MSSKEVCRVPWRQSRRCWLARSIMASSAIFYEDGVWVHQTLHGFFVYPHPYIRLDLERFEALTQHNFFWGYRPRAGDTILDIGAGLGEETLTFSRAVGDQGQVICVEAHPRTF
jgi:hypothetical protein